MVETKEYNEDNKEQIETYQRLYRQSIRHQIAYNNKAYYKLNRYTILGWNKQNDRENKDRRRQYYEKNKEKWLKEWGKEKSKDIIAERKGNTGREIQS